MILISGLRRKLFCLPRPSFIIFLIVFCSAAVWFLGGRSYESLGPNSAQGNNFKPFKQ